MISLLVCVLVLLVLLSPDLSFSIFRSVPPLTDPIRQQTETTTELQSATETLPEAPLLAIEPAPPAPGSAASLQPKTNIDPDIESQAIASQLALSELRKKVQRESDRLDKWSGSDWTRTQSLLESTTEETSTAEINRVVEQATRLFNTTLIDIEFQELTQSIRNDTALDAIAKLVAFRENHPNHPRLDEVGPLLRAIGHDGWLKLAASEASFSSPDKASSFEAWLMIATSWSIIGQEDEQREAMRRARVSIPRLTSPENVIDATTDLCQHDLFDRTLAEPLILEAVKSCDEISHPIINRVYASHLSGLTGRFGMTAVSAKLLAAAVEPETSIYSRPNRVYDDMLPIFECRAKAWTEAPSTLDSIARTLERQRGAKRQRIASCFTFAAIAAAKRNDEQAFYRMILKAESAISTESFRSDFVYGHARRLGDAYIAARQWQNAIIVANNVPDPYMQAALLFQVLAASPQDVPTFNIEELFEYYGDQRWGSRGVAGYVEYRLRSGEEPLTVVQWVQKLPDPGLRAAAYAGVARAAGTLGQTANKTPTSNNSRFAVTADNPRSLIESASKQADNIEDNIKSACAWLEVARTWNLTGRQQSYQAAVVAFHDRCFAAWTDVWRSRPSPQKSHKGTYYYADNYRRQSAESEGIRRIIDCERHLAEMQADLGDAAGALYTSLRIANHAGYLDKPDSYINWQFWFLRAIAMRIQNDTGIGQDVFLPRRIPYGDTPYINALIAAWRSNIPQLHAEIGKLREKSKPGELARATAELAILYAERGDVDGYRSARRTAFAEIRRGGAATKMKTILATADAIAGELTMAKDSIVSGDVDCFDGPSRPLAEVAVGLAKSGRIDEAIAEATSIPKQDICFRSRAFNAVATAKQSELSDDETLPWVSSLPTQNDQIAALCGLAIAIESAQQQ
tara:strand:- start:1731 stop:4472 length:2742 start_codon:yes stop_codon:yes gene_type:complete